MIKKIIICLLVLIPSVSFGQVKINEIAWMGTSESFYGEWVELFNDGTESVNLENWKLYKIKSGVETLIFILTKTIDQQGYLIIERTTNSSPDPLVGINDESGLFGGGSLNDTGEKLILKDSSGSIVQDFDFSSGWPAGDSSTKQTMQWSGSAWISALPTPGSLNATTAYVPSVDDSDDTSSTDTASTTETTTVTVTQNSSSGVSCHTSQTSLSSVEVKSPSVGVGRKRYVTVDTEITFESLVKDNGGVTGKYVWTFGDGSSGDGQKVSHSYLFPGVYNVVLNANFDGQEAVSRTTVEVYIPEIKIKEVDSKTGYLELENNSDYETNLFGYKLNCDTDSFVFPIDTIISAKDSLKIPLILTECKVGTVNWNLVTNAGKILAQYQKPPVVVVSENSENREQILASIKEKINLVAFELAKIKNQQKITKQTEPVIPREEVIAPTPMNNETIVQSQPLLGDNPDSQMAGVIVLDKEPLPVTKSLFSRLKSWFGR